MEGLSNYTIKEDPVDEECDAVFLPILNVLEKRFETMPMKSKYASMVITIKANVSCLRSALKNKNMLLIQHHLKNVFQYGQVLRRCFHGLPKEKNLAQALYSDMRSFSLQRLKAFK